MKNRIFALALTVCLSTPSSFANPADCPVPKPFKLLSTEQARQYDYQTLITPLQSTAQDAPAPVTPPVHLPQIVNFWATWCAPCRDELPLLDKLAEQQHAGVVLVNIDDSQADANKLLASLHIKQLKTYFADYELLSQLAVAGLPATLVYAESHVFLGVGALKDKEKLHQWLVCLQGQNNETSATDTAPKDTLPKDTLKDSP
ncbi:MAG: hypothetical protein CSA51_00195 [Gammaproteobacteria bacterium]|nr:MAG: hypothetical protein CSA51_00195 [Gammaproteobacteria bacterium]